MFTLLCSCAHSVFSCAHVLTGFCIDLTLITNAVCVIITAGLYIEGWSASCRRGRQYVMYINMRGRQYLDLVDFCEVSCCGKLHVAHASRNCRDI